MTKKIIKFLAVSRKLLIFAEKLKGMRKLWESWLLKSSPQKTAGKKLEAGIKYQSPLIVRTDQTQPEGTTRLKTNITIRQI